jgi:hypothetical protein
MQPGHTSPGRDFVAAVLLAGAVLASAGTALPAHAQGGVAYPAGSYKPQLPWRVLQGELRPWEMTRGINTIKVSGGMVVNQTLPASPQHVYRIKPGQAIALLYEAPKVEGERRSPTWEAFPFQWAKIIRKVDGQTVELKDYFGALSEFHNTALWVGLHSQEDMDHKFTGRLNPPLTRAEQWRTHGAWVFHSPDFAPWLNVRTRQGRADVAAVQGKLLTVYFLAHERDEQPWITIEVDFTDFKPNPDDVNAGAAATEPSATRANPTRAERATRGALDRLQQLRP